MTHEGLGLTVFIPQAPGTIPLGTVTDMVRRSGVSDAEFLAALNGNIPTQIPKLTTEERLIMAFDPLHESFHLGDLT